MDMVVITVTVHYNQNLFFFGFSLVHFQVRIDDPSTTVKKKEEEKQKKQQAYKVKLAIM